MTIQHKYDVIPDTRWDIGCLSFQSDFSPSFSKPDNYQDGFTMPSTPASHYYKPSRLRMPLSDKSTRTTHRQSLVHPSKLGVTQPREWSKSDWKLLDSCFTDERMEMAALMSLPVELANVDDIRVENVVSRFIQMVGGIEESWGRDWTE